MLAFMPILLIQLIVYICGKTRVFVSSLPFWDVYTICGRNTDLLCQCLTQLSQQRDNESEMKPCLCVVCAFNRNLNVLTSFGAVDMGQELVTLQKLGHIRDFWLNCEILPLI